MKRLLPVLRLLVMAWVCVTGSMEARAQSTEVPPKTEPLHIEIPMPERDLGQTISGDPFRLVDSTLHVAWERRLNDPHSVAAIVEFGGYGGTPVLVLGAQYRQYFVGDFDAGVHWAADVRLMSVSEWTGGGGAQVAPLIGGKFTAPSGPMVELQVGPAVQFTVRGPIAIPVYNLRIGYSF